LAGLKTWRSREVDTMPDIMDAIQQHAEDVAADALAAHAQRQRLMGRTTCANLDCGADIAPVRTALGAQLCIDCQRGEEAAQVHTSAWRRR